MMPPAFLQQAGFDLTQIFFRHQQIQVSKHAPRSIRQILQQICHSLEDDNRDILAIQRPHHPVQLPADRLLLFSCLN